MTIMDAELNLVLSESASLNDSDTAPADRLSTLPPELLRIILDFVRIATGAAQLRKGISKTLLTHTEAVLYREVTFKNFESLPLFARTVVSNGDNEAVPVEQRRIELASLVRSFTIDLKPYDNFEQEWKDFKALDLFHALQNVTDISIYFCSPLITSLTSTDCIFRLSPVLQKLHLAGSTREGENVFQIERFSQLELLTSLKSLTLGYLQRPGADPIKANLPPPTYRPYAPRLSLVSLSLGTQFADTTSQELAPFLSFFPNLESLTLTDFYDATNFEVALEMVASSLKDLSLFRHARPQETKDFRKVLSRFPGLRTLKLGTDGFGSAALLATQKSASLEKMYLYILLSETETFSALKTLFQPAIRPAALTKLTINVKAGREGESLESLTEVPSRPDKVNWYLSMWNQPQLYAELSAFVSTTSKLGIAVTGRLLDALRIQSKWNDQVAAILKRRQSAVSL